MEGMGGKNGLHGHTGQEWLAWLHRAGPEPRAWDLSQGLGPLEAQDHWTRAQGPGPFQGPRPLDRARGHWTRAWDQWTMARAQGQDPWYLTLFG